MPTSPGIRTSINVVISACVSFAVLCIFEWVAVTTYMRIWGTLEYTSGSVFLVRPFALFAALYVGATAGSQAHVIWRLLGVGLGVFLFTVVLSPPGSLQMFSDWLLLPTISSDVNTGYFDITVLSLWGGLGFLLSIVTITPRTKSARSRLLWSSIGLVILLVLFLTLFVPINKSEKEEAEYYSSRIQQLILSRHRTGNHQH